MRSTSSQWLPVENEMRTSAEGSNSPEIAHGQSRMHIERSLIFVARPNLRGSAGSTATAHERLRLGLHGVKAVPSVRHGVGLRNCGRHWICSSRLVC